jgi:hypothetical protein
MSDTEKHNAGLACGITTKEQLIQCSQLNQKYVAAVSAYTSLHPAQASAQDAVRLTFGRPATVHLTPTAITQSDGTLACAGTNKKHT